MSLERSVKLLVVVEVFNRAPPDVADTDFSSKGDLGPLRYGIYNKRDDEAGLDSVLVHFVSCYRNLPSSAYASINISSSANLTSLILPPGRRREAHSIVFVKLVPLMTFKVTLCIITGNLIRR